MTGDGQGKDPGRGGARGYSWAPLAAGNEVAVTHGARSERLVAADAEKILDAVLADPPAWVQPVDRAALTAWAHAEAGCQRLRAWIAGHGDLDDEGEPRNAARLLLQYERRAADERGRLGFDPLSRSRIHRDSALAQAATRDGLRTAVDIGRRIAANREAVDRDE